MDYVIQLNFYNYIDCIDYINILLTNKSYYTNTSYKNDNIFKHYLVTKFSSKFTNVSKSIIISYYDCYIRIYIFEKRLRKYGYELWDESVYYVFWKSKYLLELKE